MRFKSAKITRRSLTVDWADVDLGSSSTLLLVLLVHGPDNELIQFGTKWVDGKLAAVFAFDFGLTHQENAAKPASLIDNSGTGLTIRYPAEWLTPLGLHDQYRATAVLNIDGLDVKEWATTLRRQ